MIKLRMIKSIEIIVKGILSFMEQDASIKLGLCSSEPKQKLEKHKSNMML